MFITVGEQEFELKTTLGVTRRIEEKFKIPMSQLFGKLESADASELVAMLAIAAGKPGDKAFTDLMYDNWDYSDLWNSVRDLIVRLMFSGTPEQNENKIKKFSAPDEQKNAWRELLGLPILPVAPVIGNE